MIMNITQEIPMNDLLSSSMLPLDTCKTSWNAIIPKAELKYDGNASAQGIYRISHKIKQRKYIGSTGRFKQRWYSHLRELRKGIHLNSFLQNDFSKSGEETFVFEIVELLPPDTTKAQRLGKEQEWLDDLFLNTKKDQIYNISKKSVISEPKNPKFPKVRYSENMFWFMSPDNITEYGVRNLNYFCKVTNFHVGHMHEVSSGKRLSYKGWTKLSMLLPSLQDREYRFIYKNFGGEKVIMGNKLAEFAREQKLDSSHLTKLLLGKRKSVGGWTLKNRVIVSDKHRGKSYRLISPEGKVVKFNNLNMFAKDNNMSAGGLLCLLKGSHGPKKQVLSYKGWIRYGTTHTDICDLKKTLREQTQRKILGLLVQRDSITGKFSSSSKSQSLESV